MRWNAIPWAVYTNPEAAGIGLTEASAKAAGINAASVTVPGYMSGRFVAENGLKAPAPPSSSTTPTPCRCSASPCSAATPRR
ncbi:hypothetical protein [Tessaracoccus coleopterorum]|uniref:hypothetical protein n=1 Tax=Tessaracoccus coleopterorum TaxID=2714950 RepID=UPI0022B24481|nr:hypothetical protein [Tessaracoccus coleopterorum]